jgi:hypothetical protein
VQALHLFPTPDIGRDSLFLTKRSVLEHSPCLQWVMLSGYKPGRKVHFKERLKIGGATHTQKHIHSHSHIHTLTHSHAHTHSHTHTLTLTHIHTHTRTHTHTLTHTHKHTHTHSRFLLNLLRIKGLYMFRALLAHPPETLHHPHLVHCVSVMSVGCTRIGVELQSWCSQLT